MPFSLSRPLCALVSLTVAATLFVAPDLRPSPAAAAVVICGDLSEPVLQRVDPATGSGLLTVWPREAAGAAKYGFTADLGPVFRASRTADLGLVAVRRLYAVRTGDYVYATGPDEIARFEAAGYADQTASFYASVTPASCLSGVERYVKDGRHRFALTGTAAALSGDGWTSEGVQFYARATAVSPPPEVLSTRPIATTGSTAFSFAVVPDTQLEVLRAADPRLVNRSRWVLKQPKMSFLLQTGDLVNWDTDDHAQWASAARGLAPLQQAGLPYTVAVGNHDTLATGPGGGARDPGRSHALIRETATMNATLTTDDFRGVGGVFETGKVDNLYTLYRAGGLKWMVLSLEFCPRASVVAWARQVVASHPDYNVIVSTHYYLTSGGKIGTTDEGYGDSSPAYLWQQLVSRYPNVKMVFSGHTGKARKARVDTGVQGNKIYSFLTTFHDPRTNPTRLMTVDTKTKTIKTRIYAPDSKKTWSTYTQTLKGVTFVR
ncbi:metallophosphoesterase [uncultured Friedmanniella sp.]|uniref:metallophosphoesterase n=1 Tax=uncultured Friedmanniella sp. TaxID=335381 RepID=UPI0035C9A31D